MTDEWIGVDLDGTLAQYYEWDGNVGAPVPLMVERIKKWIADGKDVRIMTARVSSKHADINFVIEQRAIISDWCLKHIGIELPITCSKDFQMLELWDDRAIQIVPNKGIRVDGLE